MKKENLFKNINAVIFDLDGTLVDSLDVWHKIDLEFFKMHGREVPKDYADKIGHMNFMEMANFTHNEYGFEESPDEIAKIWTDMSFDEYKNNIKTKPFVKEFIQKLKDSNYQIGLVTTTKYSFYEACLKNNGIWDYFDSTLDVNQINSSKKEPLCYKMMSNELHSKIENTIVFEDILTALTTANKAGFRTISVYNEPSSKDEEEIKNISDYHLLSYKELLDIDLTKDRID